MQALKYLISVTLAFYLLAAAALFVLQRNILYFPTAAVEHPYLSQSLSTNGVNLEIIVLNPGRESAILYFGGNGESVAGNAEQFIHDFPRQTIYLVNYRGYGRSTGTPTEKNLYDDAQLLYDSVCIEYLRCAVIGRSLGTGVATFLATTRNISQLVLVTPFNSILNIAQDRYPVFPIALLLQDQYDSASRAPAINSPTLIILAEHDRVVPLRYSQKLIEAFNAKTITVHTITHSDHNNIFNNQQYHHLLQDFLSPP